MSKKQIAAACKIDNAAIHHLAQEIGATVQQSALSDGSKISALAEALGDAILCYGNGTQLGEELLHDAYRIARGVFYTRRNDLHLANRLGRH